VEIKLKKYDLGRIWSAIIYLSFCFLIPVYLYHILLMKLYIDPLRLITNKGSSQSVVYTIEDAKIGS
jgi:hypothetical protein